MIFVFGSNEAGIHGAGAARVAYEKHGAQMGLAFGLSGNSFAIPTKGKRLVGYRRGIGHTLPLSSIKRYVDSFLWHAARYPENQFQVTCIGCGLAGLKHEDVAPMFKNAPSNCFFDTAWKPWLGEEANYWGTYG